MTPHPVTVFDRLRQLEANATPGPWAAHDAALATNKRDAAFIVAARNLWGPLIAVAKAADKWRSARAAAERSEDESFKTQDWARLAAGREREENAAANMRDALAALERAVKEQP